MNFLRNLFSSPGPKTVLPSIIPHSSGPIKLATLCSFFTLKLKEFIVCTEGEHCDSYYKEVERNFPSRVRALKINKKQAEGEEKNQVACALYNIVLIKIVNLIGKKQYLLKNTKLSLEDRTQIEAFLAIFNPYHIKYLNKYREIPKVQTFSSLFINEVCSYIPLSNKYKLLNLQEIEYKKQFADMGYSMKHELEKWFSTEVKDPNISFPQIISQQLKEFLQWADKHPRTASHLAADIALTCATLLDQNALDAFVTALNAKTCTRLFLDALGLCPEYEDVEQEKHLKFRALADFLSYCPILAGGYKIVKKTASGNYTTFLQWAFDAVKTTGETAAMQIALRMIPQEQENLVGIALNVLRGKDMQKIIMHQRNLALLQMTGAVRQVLNNPGHVLSSYEIWWQTIFYSEGMEKKERIFTGLFLPAIAAAAFAGLFFCGAYFTGTWLLVAIFSLSSFLTHQIDKKYGFKTKRIIESINLTKLREETSLQAYYLLTTDPEKKAEIKKEAIKYVRDLQSHYTIIAVPENVSEKKSLLESKELELIEKIKKTYENKLDRAYRFKKMPLKAEDVVQLFNEVVNLKKLRAKLQEYSKNKVDTIIFFLADHLIKGWLQMRLEQAFKDKCVRAIHKTPKPDTKPVVSSKEYIANHPDLKLHPEFLRNLKQF